MNRYDLEYELTFEERPKYLYAHVKAAAVSEAIALRYLTEVERRCRELECNRLMLYRDIPEMLPTGALFFVADAFQAMTQGIRVAFVNPYVQNAEDFKFGTMICTNRGSDQAIFDNVADAEAWLLRN